MSQAKGATSIQPPTLHFDLLETLLQTVIASGDISTAIRLSSACSDLRATSEKYFLRNLYLGSRWYSKDNLPIPTSCGCTLDRHGDHSEGHITKSQERFIEFSHLLDRNPRLARSVKHLSLCLTKVHLADIHVVRILRRLRSVESLTWTAAQVALISLHIPHLVQDALVGILEGVSRLKMMGIWGISPKFFSSCHRLVDLELENCKSAEIRSPSTPVNPSEQTVVLPPKSTKLQSLKVDTSSLSALHKSAHTEPSDGRPILDFSDLTMLFLNTRGAKNDYPLLHSFTQLVHLECQCYSTVALNLNILLASLHPDSFLTLQSITYRVEIESDGDPFLGLADALSRFPPENNLQTLAIYITVPDCKVCNTSKKYWGRFNDIFTEIRFPLLRSVYIKLKMRYEMDFVEGLEERFQALADESFRRIKEQKGVDFVFDLRYDGYHYL